jgi:hypothetical protein
LKLPAFEDIQHPAPLTVLRLHQLWGAVVAPPFGRSIAAFRVEHDEGRFSGGGRCLDVVRRRLAARFPGCVYAVGIPFSTLGAEPQTFRLRVVAALDDGSVGELACGLTPLRLVAAPLAFEATTTPAARAVVRVLTPEGELRGMPLEVRNPDLDLTWRVTSGVGLALPAGRYVVLATQASSLALGLALQEQEPRRFAVAGGEEEVEVVLGLDHSVAQVRIEPRGPHGGVDTSLDVFVILQHGALAQFRGWHPGGEDDPLVAFVPTGLHQVSASGVGYRSNSAKFEASPSDAPVCVALRLEYAQDHR